MDRSQYSSYSTSAYNRFGSNQYDSYHSVSNIPEGPSSQVRFLITQELHKQSGTTSLLPLSCGKAARWENIFDPYLIFLAAVAHDPRKACSLYRVVDTPDHPSISPKAQLERRNRAAQDEAFQGLYNLLSRYGHDPKNRTEAIKIATSLIEDYFVLLSVETKIPQFPPYARDVGVDEFTREQFLASGYQRQ